MYGVYTLKFGSKTLKRFLFCVNKNGEHDIWHRYLTIILSISRIRNEPEKSPVCCVYIFFFHIGVNLWDIIFCF
jgi:hypothetical protein